MSHLALLDLLDVPGVTGLVPLERIQSSFLPQGTARPALTFNRVSEVRHPAMGVDTGLVETRWQTNVWDPSYQTAQTVREAVRAATQRKRGTFGGVVVEDVFVEMAQDLSDADEESASGGQGEHHLTLDLLMWHQE